MQKHTTIEPVSRIEHGTGRSVINKLAISYFFASLRLGAKSCVALQSTINYDRAYKKRLNDNMHRSIIVAKAGHHWIYAYLYAKKNRDNIAPDELAGFKRLAKDYSSAGDVRIAALLKQEELSEICHDY